MNTFVALALTSTGLLIFYATYIMTSVFKLKAPVYHVYMGTPAHSSYLDESDIEEEVVDEDEGEVDEDEVDEDEEVDEAEGKEDAENADDEAEGKEDAKSEGEVEVEEEEEENNAENADDESEDLNTDFTPILPLTSLTDCPLEDDIRSPFIYRVEGTRNLFH